MNNKFKNQNEIKLNKSNLTERVAEFIKSNIEAIAYKASLKVYEDIFSYVKGGMPKEESVQANMHLLSQIVFYLKEDQMSHLDKAAFLKKAVTLDEGIVCKRIQYKIDLIDVLRGLNVLRNMLWDALNKEFHENNINSEEFFNLEKKVNNLFLRYFIDIADAYLKLQQEVIASQESDFKKWEEVVKSVHKIDLNIPCREAYVAIARLQAEAIARRLGFDEEKVQDIKMAVGEACDNAIEHGVSRKGVDVTYETFLDSLRVTIRDYGPGFNPEGKGCLPEDIFSERGRGVFLIKALADKAFIDSKPGEGTKIVLVKEKR